MFDFLRPQIPLFQRVVIELQANCNRTCYFCSRESDTSGKRKAADGGSTLASMPTARIRTLFDELDALAFKGFITFHHLSEAFLDGRLLDIAGNARARGMKAYVHTNGDVLRRDEELCRKTAAVFEYVVVGLYDYNSQEEKDAQKEFWKRRLAGTTVMFSLAEKVYRRTHSPDSARMRTIPSWTYPGAPCANPQKYLLIHYNGDVCCCCEDMYGELLNMNIFNMGIREVWYSGKHREVVEALKNGRRHQYELCSKCTMGPNVYSEDPMADTEHYER